MVSSANPESPPPAGSPPPEVEEHDCLVLGSGESKIGKVGTHHHHPPPTGFQQQKSYVYYHFPRI